MDNNGTAYLFLYEDKPARQVRAENEFEAVFNELVYTNGVQPDYIKNAILSAKTISEAVLLSNKFSDTGWILFLLKVDNDNYLFY